MNVLSLLLIFILKHTLNYSVMFADNLVGMQNNYNTFQQRSGLYTSYKHQTIWSNTIVNECWNIWFSAEQNVKYLLRHNDLKILESNMKFFDHHFSVRKRKYSFTN